MSAFIAVTIGDSTSTFVLGWSALIALAVVILATAGMLVSLGFFLASRKVPTRNTRAQVSRHTTRR